MALTPRILAALALGLALCGRASPDDACPGGVCPAVGAGLLQRSSKRQEVGVADYPDVLTESTVKGITSCPVNAETLTLATWKRFFEERCSVLWEDVNSELRLALEGTPVVEPMQDSCKVTVPYAIHQGYGAGDLAFEVIPDPSTPGEENWHVKSGSLAVEETAESACQALFPIGTPRAVTVPPMRLTELFDQVKHDFRTACPNGPASAEDSFISMVSYAKAKRTISEGDGRSGFTVELVVAVPGSSDEVLTVYADEEPMTEEEQAEQQALEFERDKGQGHLTLLEVGASASVNNLADTPIGKLSVQDQRFEPPLCCLCRKCANEAICTLGADAVDELPASLVVGRVNLSTPGHGTPASFLPPLRPIHPNTAKNGRHKPTGARGEKGYGDNFLSTVLAQRSAEDHARVWAQSRALVHTVKEEGIEVADDYHFFDDDDRAKCWQPAYSQGECGSCWAFASLGALEKQICMNSGGTFVPSLSREMLVRCSEQNGACEGGNADKAYEDLMEIGGVWNSDCLPYQGKGVKHCPAFSYSWFGQEATGKTGQLTRIDQEMQNSCKDLTRYSNRPPMGAEWDMPFTMMYQSRFNMTPNLKDEKLDRFKRGFAKSRARDRVPSWWLYGEDAMKATLNKYGSIYASYIAMDDFKKRTCATGCWPPGTVWGQEAYDLFRKEFVPSDCGCPKNGHAVHIIGYGTDVQETGLRVPYWLIENSWGGEKHGNLLGEDTEGIEGWGKDPFTELHPLGAEEECVLGGWYASKLPTTGGCAGQSVNIREDIEVKGGDADGFTFAVMIDGKVAYTQEVAAGASGQFMTNVSIRPGNHTVIFHVYAKNHPKQQALELEEYTFSAVSLRCRGRGYAYSFTQNDTKATLDWGRETRAELRLAADNVLTQNGINPSARYENCPEPCRTGSHSEVIPCEGMLTTWGSCYTDSYYNSTDNWYAQNYQQASCWQCGAGTIAMVEQGLATKNLPDAEFTKWHSLVQQAFDAPDEAGWMRQFPGSCLLKSMGHNKNTQMTVTYELLVPDGADSKGGCDERHTAPFAAGQFVHAPGSMLSGGKATQRCPMPLKGDVALRCDNGVLKVVSHTCDQRSPHMNMSLRGYFKIVRGVNYHGIETGAAFAIAEMSRFLSVCPTSGWSKWSACSAVDPCSSGNQTRARNPVNGFSDTDAGCNGVMFHEQRPCVAPGFCSQVLTRFLQYPSGDISGALHAYKTQSTTLPYGTAGAHIMSNSYPSAEDAKYWCNLITGAESCTMVFEGAFQIKKSAEYLVSFEAQEGSGIFEFNTFGAGDEEKPEYQIRSLGAGASEMHSWQDVGFHHRRRRTESKPWQPVSSVYLEKGTYFGRLSRAGWTETPNFALVVEESTSRYSKPLLSGVAGITDGETNALGKKVQNKRMWTKNWGAVHSYYLNSALRSEAELGWANELVLRNAGGSELIGKKPIDRLSFTASELYQMFDIDRINLTAFGKYVAYELVIRATVILPDAGTYKFRFLQDTVADESNREWRAPGTGARQTVVARANGEIEGRKQGYYDTDTAVVEVSYVAPAAGEATFEVSIDLPRNGLDYRVALPNFFDIQMKKEDHTNQGPSGSLEFGSTIAHVSDLEALGGDNEVRIDWPDRDDPFSSELRTSTYKELNRGEVLIGKAGLLGFMAETEGRIDAGACLSLEARAAGGPGAFRGLVLELCDLDGANQKLELIALMAADQAATASTLTRQTIGWVHIGFTEPVHLRMRRDPANLNQIEVTYRPDDRVEYAKPFSSADISKIIGDFAGAMDVGVSMMSPEAYRYAEFYNISVEECPNSCLASGKQASCGTVSTACGNTLSCPEACVAGDVCYDNQCMTCPELVVPAEKQSAECGSIPQVCTNIKDQVVQLDRGIGFPAPSAAHVCKNGIWTCKGLTKWGYLAEGRECGKVTDDCGVELDLFQCPHEMDVCTAEHKCECHPRTFDGHFQCGWLGDGCGMNTTFGALGGSCPHSNEVCHSNVCCTPKTVADFPSTYQCGAESDGCGGFVNFTRPGASTSKNSGCGTYGFECTHHNHSCREVDSGYFLVNVGPCVTEAAGVCVTSPNYPANYNNKEACDIQAPADAHIEVEDFETERGYDKLQVGGVDYHGSVRAGEIWGSGDGRITWVSDSSVVKSGWKLCLH